MFDIQVFIRRGSLYLTQVLLQLPTPKAGTTQPHSFQHQIFNTVRGEGTSSVGRQRDKGLTHRKEVSGKSREARPP